ncbi:MAG: NAD+ synthase [Thermodesulfobacteriota bacterium]|nr:NAD+ synthase [Thermodesulfobacteriota bacterium]
MPVIRIAQAQINTLVGGFSENIEKIIDFIEKARNQDTDIITFPELTVCGYPPEDLLLKSEFLKENLNAIEHIRQQTKDIAVVVGYADFCNCEVYNAAAIIQNQKLVKTYHKVELPNYGPFDEKRYFKRGLRSLVFEMNRIFFTVTICEDIWIEGGISEHFAGKSRADIILNISASPFHMDKVGIRLRIVDRFAKSTNAFVCFNNLVGGQDELVFDGGSFVMNPQGKVIARAKRFKEDFLITDIQIGRDKGSLKSTGPYDPKEALISLESYSHEHKTIFAGILANEYGRLGEVYQCLILGTKDYAKKNGFKKVVTGLSGGIDSSLTAVIAVDALGPENVVGVTMPSQYTSCETLSDAELLAENLEIQLITVPLKDIYRSYVYAFRDIFKDEERGVTYENIQARIRGNILMALSNRFSWLVLTTGNKSEIAVGYCTLYGDMAGGFAVIKDVPKTIVYELSEYVNALWGRNVIPQSVLQRPPSAELRPDQRDEDTLPPYSILDNILRAYVEKDKPIDRIIHSGFDPDIINDIVRMVDRNEYKRRQAPPGIKITPKAFGKDRRLPITNSCLRNTKATSE